MLNKPTCHWRHSLSIYIHANMPLKSQNSRTELTETCSNIQPSPSIYIHANMQLKSHNSRTELTETCSNIQPCTTDFRLRLHIHGPYIKYYASCNKFNQVIQTDKILRLMAWSWFSLYITLPLLSNILTKMYESE
jgi:hypothetical protein